MRLVEHVDDAFMLDVVSRLSDRTAKEAAAFGLRFTELDKFYRWSHTVNGIEIDGTPMAVFGIMPKQGGFYPTWFMCAEGFFDHGLAVTRLCKKALDRERAAGKVMQINSRADHPDTDRWFRVLGFEFVERLEGVSVYRG